MAVKDHAKRLKKSYIIGGSTADALYWFETFGLGC
jgi:hypothetical protein